ncbi:MAG: glycosyltransferase [Verrucomicrobia bacterium]|nr:glycosyltransferase [Verrucomicrobiota bacterium]
MRITQIIPSLETRHGGPSRSVPALAAACVRLGQEVRLVATTPGPEESRDEDGLHLRNFRRGWPPMLCPSARLRADLLAQPAEVVHHHSLWLRPLHYAREAAERHRVPLVISPRGMMAPWAWAHHRGRKWVADRLVHPGALRAAAGWHATSLAEADDIRRRGFRQPVCVAPNGVEATTPAEQATARAHWQAACPAAARRPVALFFSRFHRKKRVRELLDLWLSAPRGDWLLLLVGLPEEYAVAEIQSWIDAAQAGDRVAAYDGTGRPAPYPVASLFLLPSHSENFGLVVAEAMAGGVPVITTDATPWAALNDDDRGACVSWERFGAALADALADGPDRLRERGARARDWVVREYSWDEAARRLVEFYRQLAASRP